MSWTEDQTKNIMLGAAHAVEVLIKHGAEFNRVMAALEKKINYGYNSGETLCISYSGKKEGLEEVWKELRGLGYKTEDHIGEVKKSEYIFVFAHPSGNGVQLSRCLQDHGSVHTEAL